MGPENFLADISTRYPGTKFTFDYISSKTKKIEQTLQKYKQLNDVKYLEIGAFEGLTVIWFLQNILVQPQSRAYIIDNFYDPETHYLEANLSQSNNSGKYTLFEGKSQDVLKKLGNDFFDIIHVDGSHTAVDVIQDLILSWPLLKVGGTLIIDDYKLQANLPHLAPKMSVDAFLKIFQPELEIVYFDYYIILTKIERPILDEELARRTTVPLLKT